MGLQKWQHIKKGILSNIDCLEYIYHSYFDIPLSLTLLHTFLLNSMTLEAFCLV